MIDKKSVILSSVEQGPEKIVVGFENKNGQFHAYIKCYNLKKPISGILTIAVMQNNKIEKIGVILNNNYATFKIKNLNLSESFSVALINTTDGESKPLYFGATGDIENQKTKFYNSLYLFEKDNFTIDDAKQILMDNQLLQSIKKQEDIPVEHKDVSTSNKAFSEVVNQSIANSFDVFSNNEIENKKEDILKNDYSFQNEMEEDFKNIEKYIKKNIYDKNEEKNVKNIKKMQDFDKESEKKSKNLYFDEEVESLINKGVSELNELQDKLEEENTSNYVSTYSNDLEFLNGYHMENIDENTDKIEKPMFYSQIEEQLNTLMNKYGEEEMLEKLIPNSSFVKVDYGSDGEYYILGLIKQDGVVQTICYGVPGVYNVKPPKEMEGYCQWLPIDPEEPNGFGYYITYQNASDGENIKFEII